MGTVKVFFLKECQLFHAFNRVFEESLIKFCRDGNLLNFIRENYKQLTNPIFLMGKPCLVLSDNITACFQLKGARMPCYTVKI